MVIQFATDNKTVGDALAETDRTLRDLAKNGITMQQLAKAKTNLKGQYVLTFETNNDICGLAQSLYTYGLPFDYTKKRDVLFNAVTLSDVNQVIQKLFTQPLTIITVGGNKEIQNFKSISINDIQF
jgi:zinc protease